MAFAFTITAVAALMILLNPGSWVVVVIAGVTALLVLYPVPAIWVLGVLMVVGFAGVFVYAVLNVCIACSSQSAEYERVVVSGTAKYDEDDAEFQLEETFTVPTGTRTRVADFLDDTPPKDGQEAKLSVARQELVVRRNIVREGWVYQGHVDGDLYFKNSKPVLVPAVVERYPLQTTLSLPTPRVGLKGGALYLVPADGSRIDVSTPTGMIESTGPTSDSKPAPGGELRRVTIGGNGTWVDDIELEAISPFVRHEPLRRLTHLSYSSAAAWVVGLVWGGIAGLFRDGIKKRVGSLAKAWFGKKPPPGEEPVAEEPSEPEPAAPDGPEAAEAEPVPPEGQDEPGPG